MGLIGSIRVVGTVVVLGGGLVLWVVWGWRAGLALVAGYGLGWAAFAGLSGAASLLAGARRARRLSAGLHFVKFPLLLIVLYLLLIPGRCSPGWLLVGYTLSLLAFLAGLGRASQTQVQSPTAENDG